MQLSLKKQLQIAFLKCNFGSCNHDSKLHGTNKIRDHLSSHSINLNYSSDEESDKEDEPQNNSIKNFKFSHEFLLKFFIYAFLPFSMIDN